MFAAEGRAAAANALLVQSGA